MNSSAAPRETALTKSLNRAIHDSNQLGYTQLKQAEYVAKRLLSDEELWRSADDEMAGDILDANEKLGEGLVDIGMTLGLPRPQPGATWGVPEVLVLAGQLMEMLGEQRARTDVHPYDPMRSLADGWRVHSDDLIDRAEKLTARAAEINAKTERGPFDYDPEELLVAARHNRAMAIGYSSAAADLDHSIDFARRHVLGATL